MDLRLPRFILFLLVGLVNCITDKHHNNGTRQYQYCVLGAGPAGLQMGHFLSKAKRDYVILERNSGPGSFFKTYPRHRKLISINKINTGSQNREFNLRHDWNSLLSDNPELLFKRFSSDFYPHADAYLRYLSAFEKELGLNVQYGVDIGNVRSMESANGRSYILTDQHASNYTCSILLLATGLWVPQKPNFFGSELVEGYESISTNPEDYRDQAVLILGKGNSAFETAQSILGRANHVHLFSSNPVRLAWQTHYVGDLRALNNELLDTYQLKSLDGIVEGRVENLVVVKKEAQDSSRSGRNPSKGQGAKQKKDQLYVTLSSSIETSEPTNGARVKPPEMPDYYRDNFSLRKPYDRVIRCLGFHFNFTIFDSSVQLPKSAVGRGKMPGVTAWYEGQGTPDLFVLGVASHSRDYRSSAGGFIHGYRYTVRAVHHVLENRYHSNRWPSTKLMTSQLLSRILRRINEFSGPYQMFGVLGDVILLQGSHVEYLEEFPLQALPHFPSLSGHEVSNQGLLVLLMQYGTKHIDFLGNNRAEADWSDAWNSNFLHPVLYLYDTLPTDDDMNLRPLRWPLPRPKAVHHVIEDFLTTWNGPRSHIQPLRRFLEHSVQTDLRSYYAESCFRLSLTHRKPPLFCRQGYLQQQGVVENSDGQQHAHDAGLNPPEHDPDKSEADPSFPNNLKQAGASVSSGLKFNF